MVQISHKLLVSLHQFDRQAKQLYPSKYDCGLGQLGLLLYDRPKHEGYWSTPINSIAFATTGGDGVHFSFIVQDNFVDDEAAVVMTVPAFGESPAESNIIVGGNLRDFLRFGLHRGFFALEQLAYEPKLALDAYATAEWSPSENAHVALGLAMTDSKRRLRDDLAEHCNLVPFADLPAEFARLQRDYRSRLEYETDECY